MTPTEPSLDRDAGPGHLNAALARAVVRIYRDVVGRGPTKAQAFFRHDVVVIVMNEVLTPTERTLIANDAAESVLAMRRACRRIMQPDLEAAVEGLTGHKVEASLGDTNVENDTEVLVFTLDGHIETEPAVAPT
jgi:uncharacterized protein YbcI